MAVSQVLVSSAGNVLWAPVAHHSAFCESLDFSQWPKDTQTCELQLGFWSQQHLLQLELMENGTHIEEERTGTEWELIDMTAETVWVRTPWTSAVIDLGMDGPLIEDGTDLVDPVARNEFGELEIVVHSSMAVKFTLMRRNKGYNTVLFIPLAMVLVCTLLSFWASPVGSSKLALQCLSMITATAFLLSTWRVIPVHADHIPSITYRGILVMTCFSMISTVLTINLTRYGPAKQIPPLLSQFLTSQWVSYLCFLPSNDEQVNKRYNTLDDTQQLNEEFNEKDPCKNDNEFQWNWILLSIFIDRVMFFIYKFYGIYL
ncbi:hypothetical protein J437_LFUL008579 [Ladona fulva]|uniref:Neurotransmitter-gated ion-channel ligand-binding domain-containing protein n=1 Tax=Ladona fulva TaxID=123851 RepID=A0A8K0K8F0_LADFU|nr:hypothetical protein J437_LFUL008579 [Ladona fulva]